MKVGENYVFIGEDITDEHFSHFTYGKSYRINSFSNLPDTESHGSGFAILFDNFQYGCLSCYFDKYFISVDSFRNINIEKIITND